MQACPLDFLQAPLPSHAPVPEQGVVALRSGAPERTLVQMPRLVDSAHDLHVSRQADLQQIPSAQDPEAHSLALAQACPMVFLQTPLPSQALLPVQGLVALVS